MRVRYLARFMPMNHCEFPLMKPSDHRRQHAAAMPVPDYRPVERFWPYVDLPEQPTDEELAALNPELSEALFGTPPLPFSVSIEFPAFDGPDYARAVEMARASAEYREIGAGDRAAPPRAVLSAGRACSCATCSSWSAASTRPRCCIDDRPVPYARELWLPLIGS